MDGGRTTRSRLAEMTDSGRFERLANAVLREAEPDCRRMAETGVNAEGKTVKAPLDGIVYIDVGGHRRMLAVHHTTCELKSLRRKWLGEPDGDLPKTVGVFAQQRERNPDIQGRLILTTNREPSADLLGEVEAAGHEAGFDVTVYVASALAHVLDVNPTGQWIRKDFLGVEPIRLSRRLLRDLSIRSLEAARLPDAELWVDRECDVTLGSDGWYGVEFVVGESGLGKSVACAKSLQRHIEGGGLGLMMKDDVIAQSLSVEEAIDHTLRRLQPSLGQDVGGEALSLASEGSPMVLVLEDVNRSPQPARMVELLAGWSKQASQGNDRRWRMLCPAWPRTIALTRDEVRKLVGDTSTVVGTFSKREGVASVRRRRSGDTELQAEAIAASLGFDPLLIALHDDMDSEPDADSVIETYIDRAVERLSASAGTHVASEYRTALRRVSLELLERRQLDPAFSDMVEWTREDPAIADRLRQLLANGEVVHLEGPVRNQRIAFRHDRVRHQLLADAAKYAMCLEGGPVAAIMDPYFAEVVGTAATRVGDATEIIERLREENPLALFCALRRCSKPVTHAERYVVESAERWVASGVWRDPLKRTLREAISRVLAECDGPHVKRICDVLGEEGPDDWSLRGSFRNGDILAGVRLCAILPPGVGWVGHVELIDHVVAKFEPGFVSALGDLLRRGGLTDAGRRGALRLAGYVGSPALAPALRDSWSTDDSRSELLADYFWACSQCCGDDAPLLLEPIFDAWASLSDEDEAHIGSPRVRFGADEIRFAFRERVPRQAMGYFLERAKDRGLHWPILVMLHGIDEPRAVEFVARELAEQDEQLEGTGGFFPFSMTAMDEWTGRQRRGGRGMSAASRKRLRELWICRRNGRHLRRRALRFWCATVERGDVAILKTVDGAGDLGDLALFERLRRGDRTAIPSLVEELDADRSGYWWQAGRHIWSDELTDCLDRALGQRAAELSGADAGEAKGEADWILPERLLELPPGTADRLIGRHWEGLRQEKSYVQAALHVASPDLLCRVAKVVEASDDARSLLRHLGFVFGLRTRGRRGITRLSQMEGLLPYLDYISEADIGNLWHVCNENGWFDWRRKHIDARAKATGLRFCDDRAAVEELDRYLDLAGPVFALDHWAEDFLKTGVTLEHMMGVLGGWIAGKGQEKALLMAADIVTRFGKRRHGEIFRNHAAANSEFGQDVIENARFHLQLMSLD